MTPKIWYIALSDGQFCGLTFQYNACVHCAVSPIYSLSGYIGCCIHIPLGWTETCLRQPVGFHPAGDYICRRTTLSFKTSSLLLTTLTRHIATMLQLLQTAVQLWSRYSGKHMHNYIIQCGWSNCICILTRTHTCVYWSQPSADIDILCGSTLD